MVIQQEKVTFTLPSDLKAEMTKLKDSLKVSMNSLYQEAMREFVKQKKRERLQKEAESMVDYYENNKEAKELINRSEDIFEY